MSTSLKGWVYYDNGNPVTTATVEVYNQVPALVTSGSSDANGMWSFTGLTDGITYDVKVIVGSVVRWIKGGEIHQLATALLASSLQVTGTVGIGATPVGQVGIQLQASLNAASGNAIGVNTVPTLVAQANNDALIGISVSPTFNDNGKTGVTHTVAYLDNGVAIGASLVGGSGLTVQKPIHTAKVGNVGFQANVKMNVFSLAASANNGQPFTNGAGSGEGVIGLIVANVNGGSSALFLVSGGSGSCTLVSGDTSVWSATSVASRHCVFWNGGNSRVEVNNNTGSTASYYLVGLGL